MVLSTPDFAGLFFRVNIIDEINDDMLLSLCAHVARGHHSTFVILEYCKNSNLVDIIVVIIVVVLY
jgi:hypothetical protein